MRKILSLLVVMVATFSIAGLAMAGTVTNPSAAPSGTHLQSGTPNCTQTGSTVTCAGYELAGVGNANATAELSATYSATVDCTNKGGKLVPVKSTVQPASSSADEIEPKNGRLAVPQLTGPAAPTNAEFEAAATCPNGNWTKAVRSGSVTLTSWTYTLTFTGFSSPYITITP